MKKYILILAVALTVVVISGCGKSHTERVALFSYTDLRFDKDTVDLVITPESDEFTIGFYRSNDAKPESGNTSVRRYVYILTSSAKLGTQVTFPAYNNGSEDIAVDYNAAGCGNIVMKVNPEAITEPLQLTLGIHVKPDPTVVINLIPAQAAQ